MASSIYVECLQDALSKFIECIDTNDDPYTVDIVNGDGEPEPAHVTDEFAAAVDNAMYLLEHGDCDSEGYGEPSDYSDFME